MDEDWGDDNTTTQNGFGGSNFSKGRGYTIDKNDADEDWGSNSNGFNSNNGFGGGGAPRRGGRGGGRSFGRGGRGVGRRNYDDADQNGFGGRSGGGGGDDWGDNRSNGFENNDDDGAFRGGRGRGRGRGFGGDRGDRRGGRGGRGGGRDGFGGGDGFGDEFAEGGGEGEEKKPPRSTYIPEEANDAELQDTGITSGINFDKYKDIPVNTSGENVPPAIMSFDEAGFREVVRKNVTVAGYTKLTPIQQYSIPIIMAGRDLMACAQTGSGKTAAFLLPIINSLLENQRDLLVEGNCITPHCVIISPTRELTTQIYDQARKFARTSIIKICQVYGGTQVFHQRNKLVGGCHILVATPGRLLAFVRDGLINFSATRFVVLDEADRMLDMGFLPDVETVMRHPTMNSGNRQTLMYSATFPEEVQTCAGQYLNNYIFVSIGIVGGACADIEQTFIQVERFKKREVLLELLNEHGTKGTVIFVDTKRNADFLAVNLSENQMPTTSIHGDRPQQEREAALRDFRSGRKHILVATEVAARGLDIKNIIHVINYDMPKDINQYVHRIGRTGRVGNRGKATTFFESSDDSAMAKPLSLILKSAGQPVPDFIAAAASGYGGYGGGDGNSGFGGTDIRDGLGEATQHEEVEEVW